MRRVATYSADAVFAALAHPIRRAMLRRLADGPANIGHLAEPLTMTLAAASKHVKVLVRAGLVERSDAGWHHTCALNRDPLHAVRDWLDELDAAHSARGNAKRE